MNRIDSQADKERAFQLSCKNGHLIVAQWLYELPICLSGTRYIHAENEYAFRLSCKI